MSDNSGTPPENIKDKARAILSEKASTASGVIEKSIIGGALAFVVDFVTPYLNLVVYLGPFLFILTMSCFFIWRRKRTHLLRTGLIFSSVAFSLSCAMFVYQQYVPASKKKGILATNIKVIEEVQSSLGLIDRRLSKIEIGVERIAETSIAIEKNTSATVDELKLMRQTLVALSSNGGTIPSPRTQVEFYHNARIFAQRGEVDLAIKAYEQVFKFPLKFVDPLDDLIALATRVYGRIETQRYLDEKIRPLVTADMFLYAIQKLSDSLLPAVYKVVHNNETDFTPLYVQFISKTREQLGKTTFNIRRSFIFAHAAAKKDYELGKLQSFYLDQLRAERDAREVLFPIEEAFRQVPFEEIFKYPIWITYQFEEGAPKRFNLKIFDIFSEERILTVCYHDDQRRRYCRQDLGQLMKRGQVMDGGMTRIGGRDGNAEILNQFVLQEMRGAKYFCIDKISYNDRDNITVTFDLETFYLVSLSDAHASLHRSLDKLCMENMDLPIVSWSPDP